jgi:hypothetical protein
MEGQFFKNVHELYFVHEIMPMEDDAVVKFSTWINADLKGIYLIGLNTVLRPSLKILRAHKICGLCTSKGLLNVTL